MWLVLVGALVLAGIGLRIVKAWQIHTIPDSDYSLVALMVKHLVEGVGVPVFFYGQTYMGSLEPILTALLCNLWGVSLFTVFLGTVLVGGLTLPLIYLWGRQAGGRFAGLVAVGLCLAGSEGYLHYSVTPCGGYMTMLTCGLSVVYLACRLVTRLKAGERPGIGAYVALGFVGGVGWWSGQLMVVFLLTALAILLLGLSREMVRYGIFAALPSFFAGSAPWWIWNATHQWATFEFGRDLGVQPIGAGLVAFARSLLRAMDYGGASGGGMGLMLLVEAATVILFLGLLVKDALSNRGGGQFYYKLAAPLVVLSLALVSVTSKYVSIENNQRYFLPVFPATAVMMGCAVAWLIQRKQQAWGWVLAGILVASHLGPVAGMVRFAARDRGEWREPERALAALGPLGDGEMVGVYWHWHWLNFLSGEKLCVADPHWERYAPYARRLELSHRPVFLNDYGRLHEFLAYSGSRSRELDLPAVHLDKTQMRSMRFSAIPFQSPGASRIHVDYGVTPPDDGWDYLDARSVREVLDYRGRSFRAALMDAALTTGWECEPARDGPAELDFAFNEPQPLCGLRFIGVTPYTPGSLEVEGLAPGDTVWRTLLPRVNLTSYFWSGPYLKWDGLQCFPEVRFACPTGGVSRLRVRLQFPDMPPQPLRIDEMLFLNRSGRDSLPMPSFEACLALLRQEGVKQFFGPRWLTERLACKQETGLVVRIPSFVSRSIYALPVRDSNLPAPVRLESGTGFLVEARDAARSRQILEQAGVRWTEKTLGPLVLIVVSTSPAEELGCISLSWTEQGCFAGESPDALKTRAERVFRETLAGKPPLVPAMGMERLKKALALYPNHQLARQTLITLQEGEGLREEAAAQKAILARQTQPIAAGRAVFPGGVTLLGVTLSTNAVAPGQAFEVTYFWKCPASVDPGRFAAFVNFQGAGGRFQDDHSLTREIPREIVQTQPFDEVFSYSHRVMVPVTTLPGDYGVVIGLLDSQRQNKRLKPVSGLPIRKQGVYLPASIRIL
jgi:hypothetical protein